MNEEEERIIISRRTRSAMTYRVYEDREGKLHMTIYNEDNVGTCILAVCYDIKPEKLRKHINKLEEYEVWDEVHLRDEPLNVLDGDLNLKCRVIDEMSVISGQGLVRDILYDCMSPSTKQLYHNMPMRNIQRVIDSKATNETTYQVFEDRIGNLHLAIYRENLDKVTLVAICSGFKPNTLQDKLEDLENWQKWDSVVFADTKNEYVVRLRNDLYRYCNVIDYTELIAGVGLIRTINFDSMGASGKEAYNG